MDDLIFYYPRVECISEAIHNFKEEGVNLKRDININELLGVEIECDHQKNEIYLTQPGLTY